MHHSLRVLQSDRRIMTQCLGKFQENTKYGYKVLVSQKRMAAALVMSKNRKKRHAGSATIKPKFVLAVNRTSTTHHPALSTTCIC